MKKKWNGQNYLNWCWEGKLLFDLDVKVGRFSVRQSLLTLWLDWTPQAERPGSTLATWNWQLTTCAWSHDWREPVGPAGQSETGSVSRDIVSTNERPVLPGCQQCQCPCLPVLERQSTSAAAPLSYEFNKFFNLCICISYICWSRLF